MVTFLSAILYISMRSSAGRSKNEVFATTAGAGLSGAGCIWRNATFGAIMLVEEEMQIGGVRVALVLSGC